ncbi:unnamed protein product, partial [Didymodactylos carnosus]
PLPRVIIIQLKRFTFDDSNNKIHTFVRYPLQNLNIGKYLAQTSTNDTFYNLIAISVHTGSSQSGGHYTTYAKNNDQSEWYLFNDSFLEPVEKKIQDKQLLTKHAYVLVYQKTEIS